jgi:adenylate cyclase
MPYASIRFSDAFALALAPDLTKQALFANKILIIGSSAAGLADLKHTAIAPQQPGMVLLATAIDNVRHQNALRRSSDFWLFPLFIVQLAGLTVLLRRSDSFRRFLLQSSALCLLLGSSVLLLTFWQLTQLRLLAAGPLLFWLALAYLLFNVLAAMDEYLRRQHTISVFGRFLDPRIVADLVGHNAVSVPQKCQLTVLFTDIRGFTSLSEQLAADEVLQLLNRYLDIQVQTLFAHKATLDKFIGDAIMAFWGAPVAQPEQARLALAAAKAMVENLQQFRQSLPAQLQGFDIGIGIHTGEAVVGLLGTGQRTEYTAIGDTINTASRLESASKDYGRVICSEQTVQALGEARSQFPLHHLGDILLKGRQTPVCIYRLGGEDE